MLFRKLFILNSLALLSCIQYSFAQDKLVKTIYFRSGSYSISEHYKKLLDNMARRCNSDTSFLMKIFGYTDILGTETYNDSLSEKRAQAVLNYLQARTKIDSNKVYVTWIGESDDTYDLHFNHPHSQERCVDVSIGFYPKKN